MAQIQFDGEELLALARLDIEKSNIDQALLKLKQAAAMESCPPAVSLELARLYAQLGLRHRAMDLFSAYLSSDPTHVDARFQFGMVCFEEQRLDEALERWAEVLRQHPGYPPALYYRAVAHHLKGRSQEASGMLSEALKVLPVDNLYHGRSRELLASIVGSAGNSPEGLSPASALPRQH